MTVSHIYHSSYSYYDELMGHECKNKSVRTLYTVQCFKLPIQTVKKLTSYFMRLSNPVNITIKTIHKYFTKR